MNLCRVLPLGTQTRLRRWGFVTWLAFLGLLANGACTKVTREDPPPPPPGYTPPGGTPIPNPEKEAWLDKKLEGPNPLNPSAAGPTPVASPVSSWFQDRMKEASGKLEPPKKKQ